MTEAQRNDLDATRPQADRFASGIWEVPTRTHLSSDAHRWWPEEQEDRPTFLDQFRDDPLALLGPLLALIPIVALAMLLPRLVG